MKFKTGDKIRVKSWKEIKETLDAEGRSPDHYRFTKEMKELCGKDFEIKRIVFGDGYEIENFSRLWYLDESWITPSIAIGDYIVTVRGVSPEELEKTFGERIKELKIISQPRSVTEIYEELFLSAKDCHIEFAYKGWTILAIVWNYNGTVQTGYARRKPSDTSNRKAGQSLALARALDRKDIEEELLAFM